MNIALPSTLRNALPIATLIALGLAAPSAARACTCCDGGSAREVVGWSASGQSALVSNRGIGCEDTLSFEIMRAGRPEPIGCFDGYSETPSRRTACSDLTYGYDRFGYEPGERPTSSPRASEYPRTPQQLAASHLRATLEAGEVDDEEPFPTTTLRVFVWAEGSWRPLYERSLYLGRPEDGADIEDLPEEQQIGAMADQPIEVRVWPAPTGRRALLEVSGHNDSPGMGHFPDQMVWVTLPAVSLPRADAGPSGVVLAVPNMTTTAVDSTTRQAARRLNAEGLRFHNQQNYVRAAQLFVTALLVNPAHVVARYNLACALARQSQLEPAFAVLEVIRNAGCSRCGERMARALVDEDLSALRSRLSPGAP